MRGTWEAATATSLARVVSEEVPGLPLIGSLIPGVSEGPVGAMRTRGTPEVSEEQLMIPIRAANSKLPNPVSAGSPRYRMSGPLAIYYRDSIR